jgi:hypothetical protein
MLNVPVCIAKLENEVRCRKDTWAQTVGEGVRTMKYSEQAAACEYNENNRNKAKKA